MGIKQRLFKYKNIFLSNKLLRNYLIKRKVAARELIASADFKEYLSEADIVLLKEPLRIKVGIVPQDLEYEQFGYCKTRSYYHKFERFCLNNKLEYCAYPVYDNDWISKADSLDVIVWHTPSDPESQRIAKSKIYLLDKIMHKKCIPSFDEVWGYESKIHMHYLYSAFNLPEIPTFVSHSKLDAISFCKKTSYPIISKLDTGSGSEGVVKIKSVHQALKLVDLVFSIQGAKTYFPTERQKGYVLFQKFIDDATYDLRIIVIGENLLGYYRYPQKGDFKASGAGIYEKKEIPSDALELAYNVKEQLNCRFLATDLLYSRKEQKYYIIESSTFIGVDTCEQLVVNNVSGLYKRKGENNYVFNPGKYWIQELIMEECLNNISKNSVKQD